MKKVIKVGLSKSELDRVLREVEQYKLWLNERIAMLIEKVAQEIATEAESNFSSAVAEILLREGRRNAEVSVRVENQGDVTLVIADGEDAIWCEFGTGVYYNGSVGSSPHPRGQELGYTIGTYGKGHGARQVWGWKEDGVLKLTRGIPAQMPLYKAVRSIAERLDTIAQEVFV